MKRNARLHIYSISQAYRFQIVRNSCLHFVSPALALKIARRYPLSCRDGISRTTAERGAAVPVDLSATSAVQEDLASSRKPPMDEEQIHGSHGGTSAGTCMFMCMCMI